MAGKVKSDLTLREQQLEIMNKLLLNSLRICLTILQKFVTKDLWQEVEKVIKTVEKETEKFKDVKGEK